MSSLVVAVAVTVWSGAEVDELFTDKEGDEEPPKDTGVRKFKLLFSCILPTTADEVDIEGTGVEYGIPVTPD